MSTLKARTRRWTRREYERLIDEGIFRPDERLELLDGRLVVKEPQDPGHFTAIELVVDALRDAFGPGWRVRPQSPVALARWSEPEPDVCVVPGSPRDYRHAHPTLPVLVVEVAYTRLRFDRTRKASIYGRAGVADYWIVNRPDRLLEVHRDPGRLEPPSRRWGYRAIQRLQSGDLVAPLASPFARVAVADLLP
jgi:Uma2 family endonuclease